MKKLNLNIIFKGLHFIAPFFYIFIGCAFLANSFYLIDTWKRIVFGIILIMYGLFRVHRACAKIRDK